MASTADHHPDLTRRALDAIKSDQKHVRWAS